MRALKALPTLVTVASVMAMLALAGCSAPPVETGAQRQATEAIHPAELDPIQTWNNYLHALADGNKEAIRGFILAHPGASNQARLEGSLSVISAAAGLRRAFGEVYGAGSLSRLGFRGFNPGDQLPKEAAFKVERTNAIILAPNRDPIKLVRSADRWKEDFLPWEELLRLRAESNETNALPLNRLLPNLGTLNALLERTAREVRAGTYLSAADAFGVLNGRLNGRARTLPPLGIAYTVDLNPEPPAGATAAVPIVELQGDPAALGAAHGAQLGDGIRELYHAYFARAFETQSEEGRRKYESALKLAGHFENFLRAEHREELHALAASTGLSASEAMLGQCFADLNAGGACSTLALPAAASTDGIARFARNLDYTTFGLLEQHSVLLVFRPAGRYAFASVGAPGFIGVLSGINEYGLALAVMEVPRSFRQPNAMPYMLLYRTLLENCKTVNEALELLKKTPRQSANNLMLMDATGDRAVAEITPGKVVVRRAADKVALISTNHQRGSDLDSPDHCIRFDFLHDASRRQFGRLDERAVEQLLAGAAQAEDTFQSMIFEPANRVIYLAVGADAPSHGFTRIDLKPYFCGATAIDR